MKECLEELKPSKRPTESEMEADKINDPRRPRPSGVNPHPPHPSGVSPRPRPRPSGHAHVFVSLVCFVTIKYLYSYNPNSARCSRNEEFRKRLTFNIADLRGTDRVKP